MFGRKKDGTGLIDDGRSADKLLPISRASAPNSNLQALTVRDEPAAPAFNADIAKRFHSDIPRAPAPSSPAIVTSPSTVPEPKTLMVGQDICLNGEITACDRLVVKGRVDAQISDCRRLEISDTGTVTGTAEVEEAEIDGNFDGSLIVKGCLAVRANGRIQGDIHYGELKIAQGGKIRGKIDILSALAHGAGDDDTRRETGSDNDLVSMSLDQPAAE
jgi:cytoskeletal protein CcmA (bactofilin family)